MKRSEKSKEGKIEPFRGGLHTGGEWMALWIECWKQSLGARDYFHMLRKESNSQDELIPLLVSRGGLLPAAYGTAFAPKKEIKKTEPKQ